MPAPSPEAALRRVEEKPAAEQAPSPVAEAAPGPEQSGSAKSTEAADAGAGQGGTPAAAVNHHASYLHNPRPRYPPLARRRGWEGVVRLRVRVLEDGSCDQANIATSSGHESLDEAALAAVKQWRFVPAKRGDDPVVSWVVIPIVFKLSN